MKIRTGRMTQFQVCCAWKWHTAAAKLGLNGSLAALACIRLSEAVRAASTSCRKAATERMLGVCIISSIGKAKFSRFRCLMPTQRAVAFALKQQMLFILNVHTKVGSFAQGTMHRLAALHKAHVHAGLACVHAYSKHAVTCTRIIAFS